jgi:hypothetical protein
MKQAQDARRESAFSVAMAARVVAFFTFTENATMTKPASAKETLAAMMKRFTQSLSWSAVNL